MPVSIALMFPMPDLLSIFWYAPLLTVALVPITKTEDFLSGFFLVIDITPGSITPTTSKGAILDISGNAYELTVLHATIKISILKFLKNSTASREYLTIVFSSFVP
jgi:hypothetical protein